MAKWAIYSTASCSCHGSEKTLVNAVVKTQWVAPHIVSHRQTRAYNGGLAYRLSGSGEYRSTSNALHVSYNNNPPARITAREATDQKLNILLEWPNAYLE